MTGTYILLSDHSVKEVSTDEWARQFEAANRHVGDDTHDGVRVSTVFLGLDHSFGEGPPLLFETMIFGGEHDQYQERYFTWEEAEAGHKRARALVWGEKS